MSSGGEKSSTESNRRENRQRAQTFVLTKVQDGLRVINEESICRVFRQETIQCHHHEVISFTFNQQILISENREMLMRHILQQRKGIWKWSSECGSKDKALASPEI